MEDISREWWIGYICAYVVAFGAIAAAAWYLMPKPEVPPPVAQVPPAPVIEPPPELPEFRYPERPKDPAVWAFFQKALDSRRRLPPFRIVAESTFWQYPDTTPETGYVSPGKIVRKFRTDWLVSGHKFREERHCSFNANPGDPNSEQTRRAPFTVWRIQNGRVYARLYDWKNEIRAHRIDVRNELDWAGVLRTGYVATWAEQRNSTRAQLLWSVETQAADQGGLIVVRGEPSPEEDYQQLRCEFVIDPARDHLITRERYWLQGELNRETVTEVRQSSKGHWFPANVVGAYGDRVSKTEYAEVEFDIVLEESLFEIESLPCDLEAVELTMLQGDGSAIIQHYRNGRWTEVPRTSGKMETPNAKLEWAQPKE